MTGSFGGFLEKNLGANFFFVYDFDPFFDVKNHLFENFKRQRLTSNARYLPILLEIQEARTYKEDSSA